MATEDAAQRAPWLFAWDAQGHGLVVHKAVTGTTTHQGYLAKMLRHFGWRFDDNDAQRTLPLFGSSVSLAGDKQLGEALRGRAALDAMRGRR
jgi:hypothetical protein